MPLPPHRTLALVRLFTHLLVAGLSLLTVASALSGDVEWHTLWALVPFAAVYGVAVTPWAQRHPELLPPWGALLTASWLWVVAVTPMGVWLAFPLFFLALSVLALRYAVPVVALLTAGAIGGFVWHQGTWQVGAVVGPVIGALVAIAVMSGLAIAADESLRHGQMAERSRFSREIHDTLAQGFGSIHLLLGAAEGNLERSPEEARRLIGQARQLASENLAEARRLVRAQGPAALAEGSLEQALARVAEHSTVASATFSSDGVATPLPGTHETALLRIAQEGVANVVQHAGASRLALTLSHGPQEVILDIVDDGRGGAEEGTGLGLGSMRTRAEELGGTLTVESVPGQGTAIAAWLPVPDRVDA